MGCTVECRVAEFQADINTAANIAGYLNPWGESLSLKSTDDDTPRDGSTCDSALGHPGDESEFPTDDSRSMVPKPPMTRFPLSEPPPVRAGEEINDYFIVNT